jgi:hypothetical protein
MLIITVDTDRPIVTVRFQGRLAFPEARELTRLWPPAALTQPDGPVMFDLSGVTAIDVHGRYFLTQMCRRGHSLASDATTRAIVETIAREFLTDGGPAPQP